MSLEPGKRPYLATTAATVANTEYSFTIPRGARKISIFTNDLGALRLAFTTGLVAGSTEPYIGLGVGSSYVEDNIMLQDDLVVYVASSVANTDVNLLYWA